MNVNPLHLAAALVALLVLSAVPLSPALHTVLGVLCFLVAAALLVVLWFLQKKGASGARPAAEEPSRPAASRAGAKGEAEAEVIAFLGLLQEKGRLMDFLMDDIQGVDDEQVGQAARVVYEGCREVLADHLTLKPLHSSEEGEKVTVPKGYSAAEYQLSGSLSGSAPFSGTLVHRGWKVDSIRLPQIVTGEDGALPPLAPAQVEV